MINRTPVRDRPGGSEEALSETPAGGRRNEWFQHTLYSRLNDKLDGAIVLIMHRVHASLP
jgi:hypothetical protein